MSRGVLWFVPRGSGLTRFGLTALAEVRQRLPVALQVLVDGVALVVWLQALQHVEERQVLFGVLQMKADLRIKTSQCEIIPGLHRSWKTWKGCGIANAIFQNTVTVFWMFSVMLYHNVLGKGSRVLKV